MAAAAAEASGPSCSSAAAAAAGAGAAGVSEWLVLRDGCMRCDADGLHSLSYHPALNAILAVTSRGTIKVIDGTSGATLQASALSGERGTPGGGRAGRGRSRVVGMLVEEASQPPGSASEGQRGAGGSERPGSYGRGPSDSESSSVWGRELGLAGCAASCFSGLLRLDRPGPLGEMRRRWRSVPVRAGPSLGSWMRFWARGKGWQTWLWRERWVAGGKGREASKQAAFPSFPGE